MELATRDVELESELNEEFNYSNTFFCDFVILDYCRIHFE